MQVTLETMLNRVQVILVETRPLVMDFIALHRVEKLDSRIMIIGLLIHLVIQQSGVINGLAVWKTPNKYQLFQMVPAVFGVVDMTAHGRKKWII